MRWLRRFSIASRSRLLTASSDENEHVADRALWIADRGDHLDRIYQQTSLPKACFEQLFLVPLTRYAARVQQMPAQQKTYAYPGGFLDHSLALIESALCLRRSRLLPAGAAPEEQAHQTEAWSAALVYAALLDELNTLAQADVGNGHGLALLVDQGICNWLQGFPELWNQLAIASINPRPQASELGELIDLARRALDGSPPASQGQTDVASASRDAMVNDDHTPQAPAVAHHEEDRTAENPGLAFLLWLRRLIAQQQLSVNEDNSKVHVVDGQAFLCSPALFQRYCRDLKADSLPGSGRLEWRNLQRRFEALQLHRKGPDGMSLWNGSLARPGRTSRRYSGYLLKADALFSITPPDNPNLCLIQDMKVD
ncbi:TraI domain-containing protein [Pseudomonas sp. B392_1p]|uniref:TraI domain-containing protein n=1 Tax=Pseudomonas sp. B392_1p TaxID=3457507 RepID=UPI003FD43136